MNEHVVIKSDKTMEIPEWLKDWLVQYDHKTTTITFDCPRKWRDIDLLEYAIYVSVIKKGKEPHTDLCTNVHADENDSEMIHFDWKPTKDALSEKGELSFLICARITEVETIEGAWHTKICRMIKVAEGHECQIVDEEQYEDIITELVLQNRNLSQNLELTKEELRRKIDEQFIEQTVYLDLEEETTFEVGKDILVGDVISYTWGLEDAAIIIYGKKEFDGEIRDTYERLEAVGQGPFNFTVEEEHTSIKFPSGITVSMMRQEEHSLSDDKYFIVGNATGSKKIKYEELKKDIQQGFSNGTGGTPNAVQYVKQTLTEEQQEVARGNIGAASAAELSKVQEEIVDHQTQIDSKQPRGNYALKEEIPSVPVKSVNGKTGVVVLSASDVGATTKAYVDGEIIGVKALLNQLTFNVAEGSTVSEAIEWLKTNGDTKQAYILPDGFIYAYMKTVVESGATYTNVLPTAINSDKTPYVGTNGEKGYKVGWRLNSSAVEKESVDNCCTGFIAVKANDVIRIKNVTMSPSSNGYYHWYNKNFTVEYSVYYENFTGKGSNQEEYSTKPDANGLITFKAPNAPALTYFRMTTGVISDETIITINEEIVEGGGTTVVYDWASTGHSFIQTKHDSDIASLKRITTENTSDIAELKEIVEGGMSEAETDTLTLIKEWDAPIYDANIPVFQLSTEKQAMTNATKTPTALYAMYDALMAKYPHYITKTDLGLCSDGVNHVYRYDFKEPEQRHTNNRNSETKAKAIIVSGIHLEWAGMFGLYYALEEIAENPSLRDLRRNVHLIVIPCSNPFVTLVENYDASGGQQNANGVEVHRNFEVDFLYPDNPSYVAYGELHHGGTEPLSEVESQYIDNVLKNNTDSAFFMTCHNYNLDEIYGVSFLWPSVATAYMCNMGYRLIDRMSQAWMDKYGDELAQGIASYRTDALENWDTRLGYGQISGSPGTETKQATKYGIQAANVEICERFHVHGTKESPEPLLSSFTMSRGAEALVNFILMTFGCYDHKDKKEYFKG